MMVAKLQDSDDSKKNKFPPCKKLDKSNSQILSMIIPPSNPIKSAIFLYFGIAIFSNSATKINVKTGFVVVTITPPSPAYPICNPRKRNRLYELSAKTPSKININNFLEKYHFCFNININGIIDNVLKKNFKNTSVAVSQYCVKILEVGQETPQIAIDTMR